MEELAKEFASGLLTRFKILLITIALFLFGIVPFGIPQMEGFLSKFLAFNIVLYFTIAAMSGFGEKGFWGAIGSCVKAILIIMLFAFVNMAVDYVDVNNLVRMDDFFRYCPYIIITLAAYFYMIGLPILMWGVLYHQGIDVIEIQINIDNDGDDDDDDD